MSGVAATDRSLGEHVRSEDEILRLIVDVAAEDPRIRAVLLEGSRADRSRPSDLFQDYDIEYFVTDVEPFVRRREWAERFGEILLLQQPEDMENPPPARDRSWAYLMLFTDGTRIDLTLRPLDARDASTLAPSGVVLLDKDRLVGPRAVHRQVLERPTAKMFADCCNEFLWVSTNVAKGLWRGETVYAKVMLEQFVRPQAMRMLDWYIATERGVHPGMFGRRYSELLPPELWARWARSYSDLEAEGCWSALFAMHDVFRAAARAVSQRVGSEYPASEGDDVRAYLERVSALPRDARAIF